MKSRPHSDSSDLRVPPHPRQPNRTLLWISILALAGWGAFLLLTALRVVSRTVLRERRGP